MTKAKKLPIKTSTSGERTSFSSADLENALIQTHDLMCRGLIQYEFIVTDEVAESIKKNLPLKGNGVDIVIPRKYVTKQVMDMFREWADKDVNENGLTYKVAHVPVRIKFLKNDYDYFKYADIRVFGAEQYKIPNQWDEYWKNREDII